jgi:hypothetical protein
LSDYTKIIFENLREAEYKTEHLYNNIQAIAHKWYVPGLGELVVNPILGGSMALIGVAHMTAGIALAILGSCCYIFDRHCGATIGWMGFGYFFGGLLLGVVAGLVLATPILGTVMARGYPDGRNYR